MSLFDTLWAEPDDDDESEEYGFNIEILPGVTPADIAKWEKRHKLTLPAVLREALSRQNGGFIRDSSVRVLPLDEIKPVPEDLWKWASYEEDEIPNRALVFEFAEDEDIGGQYFLNFNGAGAANEPSLYQYHNGDNDLSQSHDSITELFKLLRAVTSTPEVDWSETERPDALELARETIDVSPVHGPGGEFEQILLRSSEQLILYTHLRSKHEETLTKQSIPLPLECQFAPIQKRRPAPISSHGLLMQPTSSDEIVYVESKRTKDGQWKNSTMRGAPIYGTFESTVPQKLQALRTQLIGAESAGEALEREQAQEQLEQQLNNLSPDARRAAMLQNMLRMHSEMQANFGQAPEGPPPPELADVAKVLQQRMAEAVQKAQQHINQHAPDPDTQRKIEEMYRKMMPGQKPDTKP